MTFPESLSQALAKANGKRRVRVLTQGDVGWAIAAALREAYGYVGGGTVANAYGYPAHQTVCLAAKRSDGGVTVAVGMSYANKGAAPRPPHLAHRLPRIRPDSPRVRASILAWADAPEPEDIVLSRRATRALLDPSLQKEVS